jgi:nucleotide-binding universal stress UspA family protein
MNGGSMKVLIGYDGSRASDAIFADLPLAGFPRNTEAVVVTAAGIVLPVAPRTSNPDVWSKEWDAERARALARATAAARKGAQRVRKAMPSWKVRFEAHWDVAPWALITMAKEEKADIIVVGAHGHSSFSRFLGSVSQQLIGHSPIPVRVARDPRLIDVASPRVLLAVDGSREAAKAVEAALDRPFMSISSIHVVAVAGSKSGERSLEKLAGRQAERFRAAGYMATSSVRQGAAAKNILAEAKSWNATSILIGAREMNPLRRLVAGSTSLAVAAQAGCSVEVVR